MVGIFGTSPFIDRVRETIGNLMADLSVNTSGNSGDGGGGCGSGGGGCGGGGEGSIEQFGQGDRAHADAALFEEPAAGEEL